MGLALPSNPQKGASMKTIPLKLRRLFLVIAVLVISWVSTADSTAYLSAAHLAAASSSQKLQQEKEVTVYVTRTGEKYHRGTCHYLSRSKIPMSLKDAKLSYDACKVCRPPQ